MSKQLEVDSDGSCRVTVLVDLASFMDIKAAVDEELAPDGAYRVDLSGLQFEGSAVLPLLVHMARRVRNGGGQLAFTGVPERLTQMIEMAGLNWLLAAGSG